MGDEKQMTEFVGLERVEVLERHIDQARGIVAAVLAGLEAESLDQDSAIGALSAALGILSV